jgi:hypothetical protein
MTEPEKPIVVDESPVPSQLREGFRDWLKVIGTALATVGIYNFSWWQSAGGLILLMGPILWSQWSTRRRSKALAAMAQMLPDSLAKVK